MFSSPSSMDILLDREASFNDKKIFGFNQVSHMLTMSKLSLSIKDHIIFSKASENNHLILIKPNHISLAGPIN